jgi:hypothetical protein
MQANWSILMHVPLGLTVAVGLAILLVHRRRSRLATILGIVALCGYGCLGVFEGNGGTYRVAVWLAEPGWESDINRFFNTLGAARTIMSSAYAVFTLLLVAAVVADRRPPTE